MGSLDKSLNIRVHSKFTIGQDDSKLFLINLEDDEQCFELSGICVEIFQALKLSTQKATIQSVQDQVWKSIKTHNCSPDIKTALESGTLTKQKFDRSFDDFINYLVYHDLVILE